MLNVYEREISRAFGEVAQLTELIELNATRDADNADSETAIEILQSLIISPENSPEGRGNANEARERLRALQAVVELLAAVLQRV